MSDGSYTAVQYDTAVHYLDDSGAWQDIDNTLQLQGTSSAQTYCAANGENALSFSANLSGGELFTTAYGEYVTYTYNELDRLIRTQYNSGRYTTYA